MRLITSCEEFNLPVTPRGIEILVWSSGSLAAPPSPTLTVTATQKWYCFHRVDTDGTIREVPFSELEGFSKEYAPYADHVPYPPAVEWLVESKGWQVDPLALELMHGRWQLEVMRQP